MTHKIQRRRAILPAVAVALWLPAGMAMADQPPGSGGSGMSERDFTATIEEALRHAYEAEAAGSRGDGRELKKHAHQALEKAKEGQRAGQNERLNDGVYALGDAIEHAEHETEDATEHIKRAIMKLSQSAGLQIPAGVSAGRPKGERASSRDTTSELASRMAAYSGGFYDDGFVDDDWFYDYYELQATPSSRGGDPAATRREYRADQLYEDARTSGLFDFTS